MGNVSKEELLKRIIEALGSIERVASYIGNGVISHPDFMKDKDTLEYKKDCRILRLSIALEDKADDLKRFIKSNYNI